MLVKGINWLAGKVDNKYIKKHPESANLHYAKISIKSHPGSVVKLWGNGVPLPFFGGGTPFP